MDWSEVQKEIQMFWSSFVTCVKVWNILWKVSERALNSMFLYQELEEELHNTWQELSSLQSYSSSLEGQLSSKEREVATKEGQLNQLRWAELKNWPVYFSVCFFLATSSTLSSDILE